MYKRFLVLMILVLLFCAMTGCSRQAGGGKAGEDTGEPPAQETGKAWSYWDSGSREDCLHDDWKLILVNPWNPVPDNYQVELVGLDNKQSADKRCYTELKNMLDDCRQAGLSPVICSSYRTYERQRYLYERQVERLVSQGYSRDKAEKEAATSNAVPGTSEHQTGLAFDIVDRGNQNLDESQEDTPVQKWLMENSWRYGFILRYPEDKSEITGIIYEPWHYRYVGKEAAKEIYERKICLEEYLEK